MTVPTIDIALFDHISLGVAQLDRAITFYDAVLPPLGWAQLWSR